LDSDKARRSLSFAPTRQIDNGIREIRELVESGRVHDLTNPRFRNHLYVAQSSRATNES
jgi:hypothetical protein